MEKLEHMHMNLRQDAAKKMDQLRRLIVVYRDGR